MEGESETKVRRAHCVVLSYPTQGHVNPVLDFSKRLQQHERVSVTFVTTRIFYKTSHALPSSNIAVDTISDGFDDGGIEEAESTEAYLDRFRQVGAQTLCELIEKLNGTGQTVDCIVYDPFLPWAGEVAKKFGLVEVVFLTQNLCVDSIYYHVKQGKLPVPVSDGVVSLPGLPVFVPSDMPSFLCEHGRNPAVLDLLLDQFSNIEKADWIVCNTFYELEKEVADCMTRIWPTLRTIGPTISYKLLENNNGGEDEEDYGFALFKSEECTKWLDGKSKGSVIFVSFGTLAAINEEQMEEIAWGLKDCGINFLWVVRDSEKTKLPEEFETKLETSMVVSWCNQPKVLSHEAIGCFVTHCGWNSTLEALNLGVPMVAIPQWSDQSTNAKLIMDVWKVGLRALVDEKGIVRRESLKKSVWEIMKSEEGSEIKSNAVKWKNLAAKAVGKGGSSHNNVEEFLDSLIGSKCRELSK